MRSTLKILAVLAAVMMIGGAAMADDRAEIADLQARIASLEARMMAPAGGGDAESLTTAKKNGQITIGGEVLVTVEAASAENAFVADDADENFEVNNVGNQDDDVDDIEANLKLKIAAGPDTYAMLKLDLEDSGTDGDLLEECYFAWENVRGSNLSIIFGKDEVFFGQDESSLIRDAYPIHGSGGILENGQANPNATMPWFTGATGSAADFDTTAAVGAGVTAYDDNVAAANVAAGDAITEAEIAAVNEEFNHERSLISGNIWQGEVDNTLQVGLIYKFQDMAKAEFSLFHNDNTQVDEGPADNFLQSYAMRLTFYPIEGLELQASFVNQESGNFDESEEAQFNNVEDHLAAMGAPSAAAIAMWNDSVEQVLDGEMTQDEFDNLWNSAQTDGGFAVERDSDQMALSLGGIYELPNGKVSVYGEYIHTWNAGYYDEVHTDAVYGGVNVALTEQINAVLEGGWVGIDNDALDNLHFEEDYYTVVTGLTYTFDNGMWLAAEYAHEWYDCEDINGWDDSEADYVGFQAGWKF